MDRRTKEQCYQRFVYSLKDSIRQGDFTISPLHHCTISPTHHCTITPFHNFTYTPLHFKPMHQYTISPLLNDTPTKPS